VFELDERADRAVLEPLLFRLTGAHALPVLLVGGEPVGDVMAVRRLHKEGTLQSLITAAGGKINGKKAKGGRKH
jgi:hypothetical protein